MTKAQYIQMKLNHKNWIQNEIISLEVEGNIQGVQMYQADLKRIESELQSVGVN